MVRNDEPRRPPHPARWRDLWHAFRSPTLPGEREAAARAWARLPADLRRPDQALGRATAGCAATWGVLERCNMACTACYLTADANRVSPLPRHEVREQLRAVREHLGPWGQVQLTAGELTLLPVERLVAILHECAALELSPMLMTNGQVLLDDPHYLERLVVEGGLGRLAIHVDTTQRGPGLRPAAREADLHPRREAFAALIRGVRRRTGRALRVAHTVTVTQRSLDELPGVVAWTLRHADVFRMLSLQPAAAVGRSTTPALGAASGADALWSRVCAGLGRRVPADAWRFGHPDCNSVVPGLAVATGGDVRFVELVRDGRPSDRRLVRRLLRGRLAGYGVDGAPRPVLAARLLGRLARDPLTLASLGWAALGRVAGEARLAATLAGRLALRRPLRVGPFTVVVHRFMDAAELDTPRGGERLAACSFRVPVDGRMVSMCELNGSGLRERLVRRLRARGPGRSAPTAPRMREPEPVA